MSWSFTEVLYLLDYFILIPQCVLVFIYLRYVFHV